MTDTEKEVDKVSGTATTGHEWDGIKELDTPMPRWWLIVFYLCILWAIGYWVVYPAWPTLSGDGERGGTKGIKSWSSYEQLKGQQAEIVARRALYQSRFDAASFDQIQNDPELYAFAMAGGKAAFGDNCATCHGTGGAGSSGFPNLNDDDWLWGGSIDGIHQTISEGIRSTPDDTRFSLMPAFGDFLSQEEILQIADFVVAKGEGKPGTEAGATLFEEQCSICHGASATGMHDFGAPNLTDAIWLYGSGRDAIAAQIKRPKHGIMPAWTGRLSDSTIRQLTVYVHSLGGGE